ncbi:DUF257 family protein [Thermococcus sp.]
MVVRDMLQRLWDSLKPGEIVLLERSDTKDQHLGVHHMIKWGLEKEYKILIIDVMDSLHLIKAKTELCGLETDIFNEVDVIKVGGKVQVGNVIEWIGDIVEPVIVVGKFREAYEKYLSRKEKTLVMAVGLEKLVIASEVIPKNLQVMIGLFPRYVGDKRRISVLFVKTYAFENGNQIVLGLLEDIATTVIRISSREKMTEFKIIKSVNPELEGLCIRL